MNNLTKFWIISSLIWGILAGGGLVADAQTSGGGEEPDWDFADEEPWEREYFPIDVDALSLTPPLVEYAETQQEFELLQARFGNFVANMSAESEYAYNPDFLEWMISFITQHPDDRAALTVKYYLADYLIESYLFGGPLWKEVLLDALNVYESISSVFPETWEGKASALFHPLFTAQYVVEDPEPEFLIAEHKRLLPLARALDQEPAFFEMTPGGSAPITADFYATIIDLEVSRGNLEQAEEELAVMEQEYPDLPITRQMQERIDDVYAYQFHGHLGMKDQKLLNYLTMSEDAKTIKQAAASLGNVVIWVGLEALHEGTQERVHELALGYIDRAMTGGAAEQAEMIDLLYRLWHLATPALLETLDADDAGRVAFAGERLIYMKNEDIITAIIDKARATQDDDKKAQLVDILTRMNEPCVPVMRFRECLDDTQAQELYQRLVVPALEELQQ